MNERSREPTWPWERRRWPTGVVVALVFAAALPFLAVFGMLVVLGIGIENGYFPDSKAVPGEKLSDRSLRFLRRRELIAEGEKVIYFYSGGMLDIEGDGSFFTDERVVRYWEEPGGGEFVSRCAEYPVIVSIEPEFAKGWFEDSTIRVTQEDDEEIVLEVCNDEAGDREFAKRLQEQWEKRRGVSGNPAPK